ncbi:UNVERIFIED_CONTAM: hypothetical protein [Bacteriophage sp.]
MSKKLTHDSARKIAKSVLRYLHSGIDPTTVNIEAQIDGSLAGIGIGWKLKPGTYIDGISCQFVGELAKDIRSNAIEKY